MLKLVYNADTDKRRKDDDENETIVIFTWEGELDDDEMDLGGTDDQIA